MPSSPLKLRERNKSAFVYTVNFKICSFPLQQVGWCLCVRELTQTYSTPTDEQVTRTAYRVF